mgnify:CR=1 FL=1
MTPKTFLLLGSVAAISLIAAGAVHNVSSPWDSGGEANEILLPELSENVGDAVQLTVRQSGKVISISREGDNWVLDGRDGFPADQTRVRTNLVALSELRRLEPKTTNPELYPLLEVEKPDGADTLSRDVEIKAANGDTLARLIVGKQRRGGAGGTSRAGVYVRLEGEDRAWLAGGKLDISAELEGWVSTRMMNFAVTAIKRVQVERGITFPIELNRISGENRGFAIARMPQGMTAKSEFALQNEVRTMSVAEFDNVRAARGDTPPDSAMIVEDVTGLSMSFETRKAEDGGSWIRVAASGVDEDSKQRADQITQRTSGFEFHLSPDAGDKFLLSLADVVDIEGS